LPASSGPTLASLAVIRDAVGRFLLVRQTYKGRHWAFVGGMLEAGESPQEALVREVKEEIGLDAEVGPLIGVYTIVPEPVGYRFVFDCGVDGVPAITDPNELDDLGWFALDEIPSHVTPSVPYAAQDAANGERGVVREIRRLLQR
jgi:8-oxo-dGTP diphosphatase